MNDLISKQSGVLLKNTIRSHRVFADDATFRTLLIEATLKCSHVILPHLLFAVVRVMVKYHVETYERAAAAFVQALETQNSTVIVNSLHIAAKISKYIKIYGPLKHIEYYNSENIFFERSLALVARLVETAGGMTQALCNNSMAEIIYLTMRLIEHISYSRFASTPMATSERLLQAIELTGSVITAAIPIENPAFVKKNKAFWARSKKWALKIAMRTFSRLTDKARQSRERELKDRMRRCQSKNLTEEELQTQKQILTIMQEDRELINGVLRPRLVHLVGWLLPLAVDPSKSSESRIHKWISESHIAQVFFILSDAVCNKELHPAFAEYAEPLTLQVAFSYLSWSQEQNEDAENDPIGFIDIDLPKESPDTVAVSAARLFIVEAVRNLKQLFFSLLKHIQQHCEAAKTNPTDPQVVRNAAGALLCFYDIAYAFTSNHFKQVPVESFLVETICPLISFHPSPIISYRAAACMTQYREILDRRLAPAEVTLKILEALTDATLRSPHALVCSAAVSCLAEIVAVGIHDDEEQNDGEEEDRGSNNNNEEAISAKKKKMIEKHANAVTELARNHLKDHAGAIVAKLLRLADGNRSENLFKAMTALSLAFPSAVANSATQILDILSTALDKIDNEDDEDDRAFHQTEELFNAASNIIRAVISQRSENTPLEMNFQLAVRKLARFAIRNEQVSEQASCLFSMLVVIGENMQAITMNEPLTRIPSLSPVQWGVLADIHELIAKKHIFEMDNYLFESVKQICFNSAKECLTHQVPGILDAATKQPLVGYKAIINVALSIQDLGLVSVNHAMSLLLIGYLFESLMMVGNGTLYEQAKTILGDFPAHIAVLLVSWYTSQRAATERHEAAIAAAGLSNAGGLRMEDPRYAVHRKICAETPVGLHTNSTCLESLGYAFSAVLAFDPVTVLSHLNALGEDKASMALQVFSVSTQKFRTIRTPRMFILSICRFIEAMKTNRLNGICPIWERHLPEVFAFFPKAAVALNKLRDRSLEDEDDDEFGFFSDEEDDWDREFDEHEEDEDDAQVANEADSLFAKLQKEAEEDDEDEDEDSEDELVGMVGLSEDRQDLLDTLNVIDLLLNSVLVSVPTQTQGQLVDCLGGADLLKAALETEIAVKTKEVEHIRKMDEALRE